MKNIEPKHGDLYRDCEGNVYQVLTVAEYIERDETVVVYQEMFAPYRNAVMSLTGFVKVFYSEQSDDSMQKNDIESDSELKAEIEVKTEQESLEEEVEQEHITDEISGDYPQGVNPLLIDFLDADTIHEKVKLLIDNREKVDDKCINDIAASLDISIDEGDIDVRYYQLMSCLETMRKYEIIRR